MVNMMRSSLRTSNQDKGKIMNSPIVFATGGALWKTHRAISVAAFAVGLAGASSLVNAVPILDQSNPGTGAFHNFGKVGASSQYTLAQTFTAGLTGQLTGVDIYVTKRGTPTDPLVINLLGTLGPAPDETNSLASLSINESLISTTTAPYFLDLSSLAVFVTAGTQYAIEYFSDNAFTGNVNQYTLWRGGAYAGGQAWTNNGSLGAAPTIAYTSVSDWGFQTYVDTSPASVPEPGTLELLLLGVLAPLAYSRCQKRARKIA
jgi:hypothetical protein